ncbi:MAG: chloride channel protein [Alphaproteobacteria bacterium]|nr:chloride channel protein [Alphaproteobacteria bacterium]
MTRQELYETGKSILSFAHWRNRLVFWCGAIVVGMIAAGFAYISDYAQKLFADMASAHRLLPLAISPLILGLTGWLTARFCPNAVGSGIPQAIAARVADTHEERSALLGWRVLIGKIVLTAMGLLGGASIGREGPTVQIGAALLYWGGYLGKMNAEMSRSVILAGAGAGIAAAFNTPLAGIVFAIEEMARAFEYRYSSVVLTAIVFAGASSLSILGNYSYFGYADGGYDIGRDFVAIGVIGVLGGLLGGLFARALIDGGKHFYDFCRKRHFHHPFLFAAVCGLIIAGFGLVTNGATYGSGYEQARAMLQGQDTGAWFYTVAKFITTTVSGFCGIPGGIFSPSLSVGAGFGSTMSLLFPAMPVAGAVLLGMTAYFSGVTQAPITAFIIVLEISGRESLPVPLIAAAVIASAVSRLICPISLYHELAKQFIAQEKAAHLE